VAAAALAALALTVGLAGCNRSGSAAEAKVTLAVSTLNNPFFVDLRDGAQAQAKKENINLQVVDAQNDSSTQTNQLATAQTSGIKAAIINPVDSDAAASAVKPLLKSKLPVVAVDRAVNGQKVSSFLASDNVAGGAQAADTLAKSIGEKGSIIILQGQAGTSASRERGSGFTDQLKKYPNINVVASQTANFDRTEAVDVTTNLIQAHPDVVGIYAENDEMALGAVKALGSRAGTDVKIIGFDGTDGGLKAVKAGTLTGTIAQQPKELGKRAVQTIAKLLKGTKVSTKISIPVKTVTSDNVSDFLK
jgi:ribose transport system substrate-binding protein